MVILGINGWYEVCHDASACLLIDGEIVCMAEEERFTRIKAAQSQLPHNSIAFCLDYAGITLDDVDRIAIGWDLEKRYKEDKKIPPSINNLIDAFFPKKYFKYSKKIKLDIVPHHLAHAASTYYLSGFKDAAILTIDGRGEGDSGSMAYGSNGSIKIIDSYSSEKSLGFFYEGVSRYLGLSDWSAGKTMGLASYGKPKYEFKEFQLTKNGYEVDISQRIINGKEMFKLWPEVLSKKFNKNFEPNYYYDKQLNKLNKKLNLIQLQKDIAASAQKEIENVVFHLLKILKEKTGSKNLCLAGGVALNCTLNGKIERSKIYENVFIPPFVNDGGVSIGAAVYVSNKKPKKRLEHAYLGPEFSNDVIEAVLKKYGCSYKSSNDVSKESAILLTQNKLVSWFQGRMEAGPRALGNRSILGNPTIRNTHKKLNNAKDRENWRPLAPSIILEEADEYLIEVSESPYMLKSYVIKEEAREKIPSAVHIDLTARPQTVNVNINPKYYKVINDFKEITGVPMIMNTSFNGRGEPIVCNPYDAVKTFYSNSTDYLAIGDYLVSK